MTERDASTGRFIEWTGERCVPWADDIQVIYEHYHRYAMAAALVRGRRVLDLAAGEGYGAALLAATAAEVVGVDIDGPAVAHARASYPGVRFEQGSITDPELLADAGRFDVITCFEAIEHVSAHDELMRLVRARLAPGGLFLVSTPDITVYTHQHGNDNPYHVRELTQVQFRDLLAGSFAHVRLLRQNVAVGSLITSEDQDLPRRDQTLRRTDESWTVTDGAPHTYLIGVASDEPITEAATGALLDPDLTLVRATLASTQAAYEAELTAQHTEFAGHVEALRAQLSAATERAEQAQQQAASAEESAEHLTARLTETDAALAESRADHDRLVAELAVRRRKSELDTARQSWLAEALGRANAETARLTAANAKLTEQYSAAAGRLISGYRTAIERYAPRGTGRRDIYERAFGRPAGVLPGQPELGPVSVMTSATPLVTVVIPVHGKWSYTRQCLASIEASRPEVPFEVVVVDDCSPDDSAARLAGCPGVRLVRTERNLGFVGACNLGAAAARSDLLLFLNNDTEVRPGWLDVLVDTMYAEPSIGLAGAKLVYPDGSLQECGGIVWADGSGWNYGRGDRPEDPKYTSLRDVDYCSGAALLVRRALFDEIGGFDERYSPAYYEDTDLAFAVRAAGYRTVVQPASVVVHHEGISNGTSTNAGLKRYQEINRSVFTAKWADALTRHLPEASPANLWTARQRTPAGHGGGIVLVVDHQVPTPDQDSGSVRMSRILEQLVALGQRVVFCPANGAELQPYTTALEGSGVTVLANWEQRTEFLRTAGPSLGLVLLSRPSVAWQLLEQIRDWAPNALVAYDTVDLHYVRLSKEADLAARMGEPDRAETLRRRAQASRELELALVRSCEVTLAVSTVERDVLAGLVPSADVEVLSNVHDEVAAVTSPAGRADVLFVGGFNHLPNQDAAYWLCNEIMPLVRSRCPDAVLHLVGSNIPDDLRALASDGVVVHGWVADLAARYESARVSVAPLRFGAGVKGKVGESLAHGVPVVGTPIAFEGMDLRPDEHVLLGETAQELADQIAAVLTKDDLWHQLATAGQRALIAQFGPDVARAELASLLARAGHPVDPGT